MFGANPNEGEAKKLDLEDMQFIFKRKMQNFFDRITIYQK